LAVEVEALARLVFLEHQLVMAVLVLPLLFLALLFIMQVAVEVAVTLEHSEQAELVVVVVAAQMLSTLPLLVLQIQAVVGAAVETTQMPPPQAVLV
jgi:hypothetical protein